MSEISAAVALAQLERAKELVSMRKYNAKKLIEAIDSIKFEFLNLYLKIQFVIITLFLVYIIKNTLKEFLGKNLENYLKLEPVWNMVHGKSNIKNQ